MSPSNEQPAATEPLPPETDTEPTETAALSTSDSDTIVELPPSGWAGTVLATEQQPQNEQPVGKPDTDTNHKTDQPAPETSVGEPTAPALETAEATDSTERNKEATNGSEN